MRIEYCEATGCPHGQFVVCADNPTESAILRAFLGARENGWNFWLHGETYSDGRTRSFNFGWHKPEADALGVTAEDILP